MAITLQDIVHLDVTKEDILSAIIKAKELFFIDNLRNRHPNVSFDSKLRGYVGEIALRNWLEKFEITFTMNSIEDDDGGMDIDFLFNKNGKVLDIELKTSLIPDADKDFEQVLKNRDIKLIRRNNVPIEALKSDVHIQIYFKQLRKKKDEWLKSQNIKIESDDVEYLYQAFGASRYLTDTFLFGWIDKKSLVSQINNKTEKSRTWTFGMREFWKCNLAKEAKKPTELIGFLESV